MIKVVGVVFLVNSDSKSQKGDSENAAAANILPQNTVNPTKTDSVSDAEGDTTTQNRNEDSNEGYLGIAIKHKEHTKKKKRYKNVVNYRRLSSAFQQRQQKQFTYSVSYFNWAVSDEEDEEDEACSKFTSLSHLGRRSSISNKKSVYDKNSNSVRLQRNTKRRVKNQELLTENEVSELSVISTSAKGVVLTEEFIEVTLPFKRLSISKNTRFKK